MARWSKLAGLTGACVFAIAVSGAWAQTGDSSSGQGGGTPVEQTAHGSEDMRAMMREMMQEMMRQQRETGIVGTDDAERDDNDNDNDHGRWTRRDHMGARGMGGRAGMMRGAPFAMQHGAHLRVMFAIVDTDGNGTLSLQEVQDFNGRIFRAVDENDDGQVGVEEVQSFWRGQAEDNPR